MKSDEKLRRRRVSLLNEIIEQTPQKEKVVDVVHQYIAVFGQTPAAAIIAELLIKLNKERRMPNED